MPVISIIYAHACADVSFYLHLSLFCRRLLLYNNIGDEMRIFLWLLAAAFLAAGIYQKEYMEVLHKAILICLECIGIG